MTRRFPCPKCNTIGWKITIRSEPGSRYSRLTDIACLNCGHEIYFDNAGFVIEDEGEKPK